MRVEPVRTRTDPRVPVGTPTCTPVRTLTGPKGLVGTHTCTREVPGAAVDSYMYMGVGLDAYRTEEAGGDTEIHVKRNRTPTGPRGPVGMSTCTWEPIRKATGPGGYPYMHEGAGTDTHRPEVGGGDPYMHVGAGLDAH